MRSPQKTCAPARTLVRGMPIPTTRSRTSAKARATSRSDPMARRCSWTPANRRCRGRSARAICRPRHWAATTN